MERYTNEGANGMTGYTKGPWKIGAIESGRYAVDGANDEEVTGWIDKGDALLISAAPDLLEALELLYGCITETETSGPDARAALEKAREAIAKARGDV